jgi:hypothetical protein
MRLDHPIGQAAFIISGILPAIALTGRHLDLSLESLGSCSSFFSCVLLFAVLLFVKFPWLTTEFPKSQE